MWNHAIADTGSSGLLVYVAAYAAMLVIPGPSFVIVSQVSLSASRREAALVAVGVASGAGLLVMLVFRGTASLPASQAWADAGRLTGALVLLVVGVRALARSMQAGMPMPAVSGRVRRGRHFAVGLVTALTNPISFSFFSSVVLASGTARSGMNGALVPAAVFMMALSWFGLLAMLLSMPSMRTLYGRAARRLDAVVGAALIVLALSWLLGTK